MIDFGRTKSYTLVSAPPVCRELAANQHEGEREGERPTSIATASLSLSFSLSFFSEETSLEAVAGGAGGGGIDEVSAGRLDSSAVASVSMVMTLSSAASEVFATDASLRRVSLFREGMAYWETGSMEEEQKLEMVEVHGW